jgi:hypothetical protein
LIVVIAIIAGIVGWIGYQSLSHPPITTEYTGIVNEVQSTSTFGIHSWYVKIGDTSIYYQSYYEIKTFKFSLTLGNGTIYNCQKIYVARTSAIPLDRTYVTENIFNGWNITVGGSWDRPNNMFLINTLVKN